MRRVSWTIWCVAWLMVAIGGCHREEAADAPFYDRKIGISDKFYDVQALSPTRAIVVGYGGKILQTQDGGRTWELLNSGTRKALYSVHFVDDQQGWICGQDGIVLHTTDGGKTWNKQDSGSKWYLFALAFIDANDGWVVGDRATYFHTTDGGQTWSRGKLGVIEDIPKDEALVAADPILYDVKFRDHNTGWIVGEFGKIFHTADGGKTWTEQQGSLLGSGNVFNALDLPTFFGVNFVDDMNGVVAGLDGKVARTRDGGQTWKFEEFDLTSPIVDPLFRPYQFPDTTAWAVGAAGEVVRQSEPRQAWQRASLGMEIVTWLRGIDFYDKDNGWIVGGFGLILHTTDGGKTWLPSIGA